MRPILVDWLDQFLARNTALLVAPTWFTMVGLAGVVTLLVMMRMAKRHGIDPGVIASAILWGYLAAVVAGIAVPMMIDAAEQYVSKGRVHVRWAGMTSFWGYAAGTIAVIAVCRGGGLSPARLGDLATAPLGIALCFARIGCFIAGCDYGKVTDVPWAMRFPQGSPAWRDHVRSGLVPPERTQSLPVHPTQLYEAILGLAIAVGAVWLSRQRWAKERAGRVFLCAAAAYAVGRFGIEELRGDAGRGFQLGLSSGQLFALVLLAVIGAGFLMVQRAKPVIVAVTTAAAMTLVCAWAAPEAHAQPSTSQPISPYDPVAQPMPAPAPAPTHESRFGYEAGALMGWATPLNRKQGQVAPLAGPSISIGAMLKDGLGLWIDFDSMGNADASHGTLLVSGSATSRMASGIEVGARVGAGTTLVNFDEPAFRDVAGATVRAEGIATYPLDDHWALSIRPISFDLLTNDNLGGPILTWQVRIGVAYRFGGQRRAADPAAGPPPPPPPPVALGGRP